MCKVKQDHPAYKATNTGAGWAKLFGDVIMDPDGWDRKTDEFSTLRINYREYMNRVAPSTVQFTPNLRFRLMEHCTIVYG